MMLTKIEQQGCEGDVAEVLSAIEAVVFDLDGTLTDSIANILNCTRATFEYFNLPKPDDEQIKATIGMALPKGLGQLLPADYQDRVAQVVKTYRQIFAQHPEFMLDKLFPKTELLLERLKEQGFAIAFASGRSTTGVERTLNNTVLGRYATVYCGADKYPSKPHPQMLFTIAQKLGLKPEQLLMVGDSNLDIELGKNAHSYTAGVQTGVLDATQLKALKPDLLLPMASDLLLYL